MRVQNFKDVSTKNVNFFHNDFNLFSVLSSFEVKWQSACVLQLRRRALPLSQGKNYVFELLKFREGGLRRFNMHSFEWFDFMSERWSILDMNAKVLWDKK